MSARLLLTVTQKNGDSNYLKKMRQYLWTDEYGNCLSKANPHIAQN